jgi:hypothetical protein
MNCHTPYTYLIGWSQLNTWYYGVRYAKACDPTDFWTSYFTSSKYVKNFRVKNGEPDILQIRKTFRDKESAQTWETKVLQRMRVIGDERFLNKAIGKSLQDFENRKKIMIKKYGIENSSQLPDVANKISKSLKGKPKSEKHKQNLKRSFNKQSTKDLRSINSKKTKESQTPEKRREISSLGGAGNRGIPKSDSWKEKTNVIKRKTYIINDSIIVYNAKEYCYNNNVNYISFTQAAKYEKIYKGLKIRVVNK